MVVVSASEGAPAAATDARQREVVRSNAGVQRVEVLAGNVGYLNLTTFWREEEARETIGHAMRSSIEAPGSRSRGRLARSARRIPAKAWTHDWTALSDGGPGFGCAQVNASVLRPELRPVLLSPRLYSIGHILVHAFRLVFTINQSRHLNSDRILTACIRWERMTRSLGAVMTRRGRTRGTG